MALFSIDGLFTWGRFQLLKVYVQRYTNNIDWFSPFNSLSAY